MLLLMALVVGLCAGFIGSIPIAGPIAVLVLETGLEGKHREAVHIVIGSAVAESLYAALAFLGVSSLVNRFPNALPVERIVGAIVIIIVGGYFAFRKTKPATPHTDVAAPKKRKWLVGFWITALNPTLLVSWTAVIAALHGAGLLSFGLIDAIPFAIGVLCGVVAWFFVLLTIVKKIGKHVSPKARERLVHGMGYVLIAVGLVMGARSILMLLRHGA